MGPIEVKMREKLQAAFSPVHFEIENESHKHSVPKNSETHFRVVIASDKFTGLSRVARQRLVHEVLSMELKAGGGSGGIHALTQRLLTPQEWETAGGAADFQSPDCHGGSKVTKVTSS
jgi:stress-induced morphogen